MTALSGRVELTRNQIDGACLDMLQGQQDYGSGKATVRTLGAATFGLSLFETLPEDVFDRQPLIFDEFLMVADIRLDNRDEIIDCLGLDPVAMRGAADADVLLKSWVRWREEALGRIVGDFALAVYSTRQRTLTLARDPTGQRPLFYTKDANGIAFSSMPSGLLAVPNHWRGFDRCALARTLCDLPREGEATYYEGISRVLPGQMVTFTVAEKSARPIWHPDQEPLKLGGPQAYVEAYREVLDNSVGCRLRRKGGRVAAHLSSGFDSSAVAATAARLISPPDSILAFTSAPRIGFDALAPRGRFADESELAAQTARMNHMEHVIIRTAGSALAHIRDQARTYQEPLRNIVNGGWLSALQQSAKAHGATVMLTGEYGNLTLNAGGLQVLGDLVARRAWGDWWKEARKAARRPDVRWRGIMMNSFGARIPDGLRGGLYGLFHGAGSRAQMSFLKTRWIDRILGNETARDHERPTGDSYSDRLKIFGTLDFGTMHKGGMAESGVDMRNPLGDRRVIEFSMRLPRGQLFSNGVSRPLARLALADRVPIEIIDAQYRGYQAADCFEHLDRREVRHLAEEIAESEVASELIDLGKIEKAIDQWPENGFQSADIRERYVGYLPMTLATGMFMLEVERMVASARKRPREGLATPDRS